MMRERVAILLISAALIGFQLAIIQMLSYSQWHHFAYLAVSIAMLGFGASGVILSVYSTTLVRLAPRVLPWLFASCGLLIIISPMVINSPLVRFDPFLLFTSLSHIIRLLTTCFILTLPFLAGAMVIGLYFMVRSQHIPLLYAWNLAGSALGGITLVLLSRWLLPMNLASIFGLWVIVAGCLVESSARYRVTGVILFALGVVVLVAQPRLPYVSEYKALSQTLLLPGTKVVHTQPLPQGVYQKVSAETLRQAQGLSLTYTGTIPLADMVFLNAHAYCALERLPVDADFYRQNLLALPYVVASPSSVLLLEPAGTFYASQALEHGAERVSIVEPIPPLARLLEQFPWVRQCAVDVVKRYPRVYLSSTNEEWDAIVFPPVGSFGGGAGLSSMQEQYLLTTEAVGLAMGRLVPNGVLSMAVFMDNPPRYSIKLLALVCHSLQRMGLNPREHTIAMRNWNTLLVVASRSPLGVEQVNRAKEFANVHGFDMVYPELDSGINTLTDTTFHVLARAVLTGYSRESLDVYPFKIRPPTDNSPYFAHFLKLSQFPAYISEFGFGQLPYLELGYLVVWASLLVCLILALGFIAIPLMRSFRQGSFIAPLWFYFAFLGLGYMLVEIALIQRSILVLGNPITSSAVIISAILCFSAVGSYFSSRLPIKPILFISLACISALTVLLALTGGGFTYWLLGFSFTTRAILLVMSILPLSVLMGVAFPTAMRYLSVHYPQQIPIAWGVNGFFSVLAAPMGTLIAVESGFTQVLILSALLYLLCLPLVYFLIRRA